MDRGRFGADGGIRTPDRPFTKRWLCLTELHQRKSKIDDNDPAVSVIRLRLRRKWRGLRQRKLQHGLWRPSTAALFFEPTNLLDDEPREHALDDSTEDH